LGKWGRLALLVGVLGAALHGFPESAFSQGLDPSQVDEAEEAAAVVVAPSGPALEPHAAAARGLTVALASISRTRAIQLIIEHRAYQQIDERTWHDLAGLDGGALRVGLGLAVVPLERLELRMTRVNGTVERYDTIEAGLRYQMLHQDTHQLDLALGVTGDWFVQPKADDAAAWGANVALGRSVPGGLTVTAGALAASDSSSEAKGPSDQDWSAAVYSHLAWVLPGVDALELDGEVTVPAGGFSAGYVQWAGGITGRTWRHRFTLLVTNTQALTVDALAPGAWRSPDDIVFGFTILRQWDIQ